jgi:putative flavoprotein involved in K+ transport
MPTQPPRRSSGDWSSSPPTVPFAPVCGSTSVIWCTGFGGDFSWLGPTLLDADGQPRRQDADAVVPGVWYLGLRWLRRRSSGILLGFPGDAATVADAIRSYLDN